MFPGNKELSEEMRTVSRAAIIAAASKLFAESGYHNCRISDIARQAEMSRGNVYWYFSSYEALLKAMLADAFDSLGAAMEQAAAGPGDRLLPYARSGSEINAIRLSLMGTGGGSQIAELGFDMRKIGERYTLAVLSILTQAQADSAIQAGLDPQALTMMIFGMFNGLSLVYGQEWLDLPPGTVKAGMFRWLLCLSNTCWCAAGGWSPSSALLRGDGRHAGDRIVLAAAGGLRGHGLRIRGARRAGVWLAGHAALRLCRRRGDHPVQHPGSGRGAGALMPWPDRLEGIGYKLKIIRGIAKIAHVIAPEFTGAFVSFAPPQAPGDGIPTAQR